MVNFAFSKSTLCSEEFWKPKAISMAAMNMAAVKAMKIKVFLELMILPPAGDFFHLLTIYDFLFPKLPNKKM